MVSLPGYEGCVQFFRLFTVGRSFAFDDALWSGIRSLVQIEEGPIDPHSVVPAPNTNIQTVVHEKKAAAKAQPSHQNSSQVGILYCSSTWLCKFFLRASGRLCELLAKLEIALVVR